jgi:hypothetical protein
MAIRKIQLGLWHGSSNPSIKTSIGKVEDHEYLNLALNPMPSYEVEDIEPQEDGKPLWVVTKVLRRIILLNYL